ncbi:MAG: matrixin family metalloprotease [Lacunisphaera sp.]|nr:matrixin family metalloprotease [Lacunisphaera sp.]
MPIPPVQNPSINPRRLGGGLIGAALLGTAAWGFVHLTDDSGIYVVVWNPGTITMQLKLPAPAVPLSDGAADYNASVQAAMQAWNSLLGVVQLNGAVNGSAAYHNGNRINEIAMASTIEGDAFSAGTLALTLSFRSNGNTRSESDIVFNTNPNITPPVIWDSYRGVRRPGVVDIQRVALHELGHVLGLDHPDTAGQQVSAIMNSRVSDADALREDDITGVQVLYGAPGFVPANNNFGNATTITLSTDNTGTFSGSNVAATKETGEPNHANNLGGHSVWWKWTANGTGSTTMTTLGSNFDTTLAVYNGSASSALTTITSNDDVQSGVVRTSTVAFNASSGTTYYFAVDGRDAAFGSVTLNLRATLTGDSAAPVITTQPASATVTTGGSATFSVVATGAGPLTYQWSFGSTAISGATSDTLTLNNVQSGSGGSYAVVVTNAAGSTTSNSATLIVSTPVVTPPAPAPAPARSGGGGGGAPSLWFYGALSLLGLGRFLRRRE